MPIDVELANINPVSMLNDRGINRALDKKRIVLSTDISDDQIQPGSLDARIGKTYVFDDESRAKYFIDTLSMSFKELDDYEPSRDHAKFYPDEKGVPIIIPPKAFVEIYFHENISFNKNDFNLSYELRSSRGRLGLQPYTIYPKDGYVELTNHNPNTIILYGQDKFANLFFNLQRKMRLDHGKIITNPKSIKKILPNIDITPHGYVLFRVGKVAKTFKNNMTLDTAKTIDDTFYNTHDLSKGYVLETGTPAIVQLTPNIKLPADIGIMLTHRIPFHTNMQQHGFAIADFNQVNAGWVDQGYNGEITAHPVYYMRPRLLREGDVFSVGVVYKFNTDSNRVYGDKTLGSHYQNSKGATTSKS